MIKSSWLKFSILICLNVFETTLVFAQGAGEIKGVLKDATTKELLPFATLVLYDKNTKGIIKTSQTDEVGNILIGNIPTGDFTLQITSIGYQPIVKDSIGIRPTNLELNLGEVFMQVSADNMLHEVNITAKKLLLQEREGKKIFEVSQSLISVGGTAADVLQNVPTLQIDANGQISLRGANRVSVLVDGKLSLIGGGDISQVLQSIPANTIEKIEVIANPSARYNAEGNAVVNIITKKNSLSGFNGSTTLSIGTRDNYLGSTNLSFQNKKLNVYGHYTYQYGKTLSYGFQNISYLENRQPTGFSNEIFPSITLNKGHTLRAGIEFTLTKKSTFNVSAGLNPKKNSRDEVLHIDLLDASGLFIQQSKHDILTRGKNHNYDLNLDFYQQFKKPKEELAISVAYANTSTNAFQSFSTDIYQLNGVPVNTDTDFVRNYTQGQQSYLNIQADYTLPLGKTGLLETGFRNQTTLNDKRQNIYNLNQESKNYDFNYRFSNEFTSNNQIQALYINFKNQIQSFSYQLGLRGEHGDFEAILKSYDVTNKQLYDTPVSVITKGLYPSIFLSQQLGKEQQLKLNYTRRVNRPSARELNPFYDLSDPVNYEIGNTKILPEDRHSIELVYSKNWKRATLNSSLYYSQINHVLKQLQTNFEDVTVLTTSANLRRATIKGLEIVSHVDVLKNWDFTANLNLYHRDNAAAPEYGIGASKGFSWNANITNNISLVKNLSLQLRVDYRAKDKIIQDRYNAAYGIDIGANYSFLNKKASLVFSSRDILNSRKRSFLRASDDILLDFERRTLGSRATFSFVYRFGKTNFSASKPKKTEEQPAKRIDANGG